MSVLLDVNEELVKLYHQLRCPREVRTYCKQTILLSQQLVLPIRCAYYLVYLAQADLRSSRYDDSQVRIDGLADILCLRKYNVEIDQENKPPPNTEIEKDIADLTSNMQEMVLDLPIPENYKKQFSPSSPALVIQPFRLPAFLDHENDCGCFYCTSLEYQSLVLEKTRLDALLNVKRNNFAISRDFYHGALNFYKLCSKKYESSVESKVKFISYDLVPEFERELLGVYGFTLLDYSYHLMRTKNKLAALKVTNRLIDLVSSRKIQHVYLYNEALFQKLGYVTEVPAVAVGKAVEVEGLCAEPNVVSKTPESKHSKVTFMVQYTPAFSPPKRRVKKCLPFNLSPDEDTVNNKLQEKMTPIPKQPKTPAPKIKIYSNGDTSQKSKNPPTAIHIFTDESKKNKRIRPPVVNDSCSSYFNVIPKTPASTRPVNCESSLKTRTKLLTDKLRQSARKPEVPVVGVSDDDTSEPEISHSKKKSSLRKNLFKQENTEEPNVAQGGALRRSARRKNV